MKLEKKLEQIRKFSEKLRVKTARKIRQKQTKYISNLWTEQQEKLVLCCNINVPIITTQHKTKTFCISTKVRKSMNSFLKIHGPSSSSYYISHPSVWFLSSSLRVSVGTTTCTSPFYTPSKTLTSFCVRAIFIKTHQIQSNQFPCSKLINCNL